MKCLYWSAAMLLVLAPQITAFTSHEFAFASFSPHHPSRSAILASIIDELPSDTTVEDPEKVLASRNRLIALSSTLSSNSATGRFISRPSDKIKLQKLINELESFAGPMGEKERDLMLGDWELVATANVANPDVRRRFGDKKGNNSWFGRGRSGLSLLGRDGLSLDPLQKTLRKSIEVTQRIRNDIGSDEKINRVDNVVEFTPLDTLSSLIPEESPLAFLSDVNVNPLQVKKSKVVLIHKAEVESVAPVLRTKIAWVSTVLNVAGTSQFLEPDGSDVFGVNNLLGEFRSGTFETPYIDEDIRISRTRGPVFEQLRVFVRKNSDVMSSDIVDTLEAELRVEEEMEVSASNVDANAQMKKVADAAEKIGDAITSIGVDVGAAVTEDLDGVNRALSDAMDDVVEKVQDVVEDDLKDINTAVKGVQKSLEGEGDVVEAVGNVAQAVAKVPGDVKKVVDDDLAAVSNAVEEESNTLVKNVQNSVEENLKKINESMTNLEEEKTEGGDN